MLQRIDALLDKQVDFAFETTLSTRSYVSLIKRAKETGYTVTLLFIYLSSAEMAVERVAKRVSKGGHHIPEDIVHRRYIRVIRNLINLYMPICDAYIVIDNSDDEPVEIVRGNAGNERVVSESVLWNYLQQRYGR